MIMPSIDSSFRYFSQVLAIFSQSRKDMFSDHFVSGLTMIGLQISLISGAMFRIVSLSVDITTPVFGSSRDEIVPPVIMIATFGSLESLVSSIFDFSFSLAFSVIVAFRISFSRIPILYPDFSFRRIISGSWDSREWPCQVFVFVFSFILSPGLNVFVSIVVGSWEDIKRFGVLVGYEGFSGEDWVGGAWVFGYSGEVVLYVCCAERRENRK